jgi:hypothetical protein
MSAQDRYGRQWRAIEYVRDVQLPRLDRQRAYNMRLWDVATELPGWVNGQTAAMHSTIGIGEREHQAVSSSEDLRKAVWETIWDSTWRDAWQVSWLIARAGLGYSTFDLVGNNNYTMDDYLALVGPWSAGFPEYPVPLEF